MQAKIMQGDGNVIEVDDIQQLSIFTDDNRAIMKVKQDESGKLSISVKNHPGDKKTPLFRIIDSKGNIA